MLFFVNSARKRVRLVDVAERAGVSRSAAGHVLLGAGGNVIRVAAATAKRIRRVADELGYHPNRAAQQLRGASTQTLGVLMDTVNAPVMNDRLAAIEHEAASRGYRLLIGQLHGDPAALRAYLGDFDGRGVDAIFCLFDVTSGRAERLAPLLGGRNDIVMHGKPIAPNGYCVRVDTARAVACLIAHLVERGRRRIALQLGGSSDELMALRRDAYTSALKGHGLRVSTRLIWTAPRDSVDPTAATACDAIDRLVIQARADAVVASNDIWAAGLIQALKARGRHVPDDVAVTGYDNLRLGTIIDPPLTTIDQQHGLYARAATDLLVGPASGRIEPPRKERTIVIPPKLIVRRSTGPETGTRAGHNA
jgi:DNA-binding LacI/PurR family transcriptional regulator